VALTLSAIVAIVLLHLQGVLNKCLDIEDSAPFKALASYDYRIQNISKLHSKLGRMKLRGVDVLTVII